MRSSANNFGFQQSQSIPMTFLPSSFLLDEGKEKLSASATLHAMKDSAIRIFRS